MSGVNEKLGRFNSAFAMAAAITILFSTALAWAKDAYKPLNGFMNALVWHNWITHGLADVILFAGLGVIFSKTRSIERMTPRRVISFLVGAVIVAGVGLFVWYAAF